MLNKVLFTIMIALLVANFAFCQSKEFKGLELDLYGYQSSNIKIRIDEFANMSYTRSINPIINWFTISTDIETKGKFSDKEFDQLKNRLKDFNVSYNGPEVVLCGHGSKDNYFEMFINDKWTKYSFCPINLFPQSMLNYLVTIDTNIEIKKKHTRYVKHLKNYWRMIFPSHKGVSI